MLGIQSRRGREPVSSPLVDCDGNIGPNAAPNPMIKARLYLLGFRIDCRSLLFSIIARAIANRTISVVIDGKLLRSTSAKTNHLFDSGQKSSTPPVK